MCDGLSQLVMEIARFKSSRHPSLYIPAAQMSYTDPHQFRTHHCLYLSKPMGIRSEMYEDEAWKVKKSLSMLCAR